MTLKKDFFLTTLLSQDLPEISLEFSNNRCVLPTQLLRVLTATKYANIRRFGGRASVNYISKGVKVPVSFQSWGLLLLYSPFTLDDVEYLGICLPLFGNELLVKLVDGKRKKDELYYDLLGLSLEDTTGAVTLEADIFYVFHEFKAYFDPNSFKSFQDTYTKSVCDLDVKGKFLPCYQINDYEVSTVGSESVGRKILEGDKSEDGQEVNPNT